MTAQSGVFGVGHFRPPPLSSGATESAELERRLAQLELELRKAHAQNAQLRLTIALRDDRIRQLEESARAQRARADTVEEELSLMREQKSVDDLTQIPGIGPVFERGLKAIGVTTFQQIASWTDEEVDDVARQIGTSPRRIARYGWVEHARAMASPPRT